MHYAPEKLASKALFGRAARYWLEKGCAFSEFRGVRAIST